MRYMINKDGTTRPEDYEDEALCLYEKGDTRRIIKYHYWKKEGITVSTIFLIHDYSFGQGRPVLFETMVFDREEDKYCLRYFTKEEADKGHDDLLAKTIAKFDLDIKDAVYRSGYGETKDE